MGNLNNENEENNMNTPFQRVSEMNEAFGNPKGDASNIDWTKVRSQCKNIFDEYIELMVGLGLDSDSAKNIRDIHSVYTNSQDFTGTPDTEAVRDALCDIQVFVNGAQHMMGYDGDSDMDDVIDGVMSRLIKSPEDKEATYKLHAAKGVTDVYFEGNYPKMVMKSGSDQPDAPKGKFLKAASFKQPVFRKAP